MNEIWYRWYVERLGMSGVCHSAHNIQIAKEWIYDYITHQFDDLFPLNRMNFNMDDIVVWDFDEDDDFNSDYPEILATNY